MFYAAIPSIKPPRPENILMIYVPNSFNAGCWYCRPLFRYLERLVSTTGFYMLLVLKTKTVYCRKKYFSCWFKLSNRKYFIALTDDWSLAKSLSKNYFPAILSYLVGFFVVICWGLFSWPLAGAIAIY